MASILEAPFAGYLPLNQLFAQLLEDTLSMIGEHGAWGAKQTSRLA